MANEEQESEWETLQAIYMDEIKPIKDSPRVFEVIVKGTSDGDAEDDDLPQVTLQVTYTPEYPAEVPLLEVTPINSLVSEEQALALLSALEESAKENVGMVMIFTLITVAKDWIDQNVKSGVQIKKEQAEAVEAERVAREIRLEELRNTQREGTPVTTETFAAWRANFEEEMRKAQGKTVEKTKKLSGRKLFESDATLNTSDMAFDEEMDLKDSKDSQISSSSS
eukprot:TRINITY_DN16513_c0_g1_i1.p1 TRINITY_DN16513_c0_g1~~TRINITY_DN16513_c0_g1_i1.p1  ORF type:complete len:246 (-),score=77.13 TRINITY_DN16513_c0_g1_i1:114-785(-)